MGSVKEYFSSLGTGIASLVKGLTVTGKEFVTPKITECYPENRDQGVAAVPNCILCTTKTAPTAASAAAHAKERAPTAQSQSSLKW